MTIAKKLRMIVLLSAGTVPVFILLFALAFMMQSRAQERMTASDSIARAAAEINIHSGHYLRHPEESMYAKWMGAYNSAAKILKQMPVKDTENRVVVDRMLRNLSEMNTFFSELAASSEKGRRMLSSRTADALIMRAGELTEDAFRLVAVSDEEIRSLNRVLIELFTIISVLLTLAVLLTSVALGRRISGPINKLRAGTEVIGSGNLDYRTGIRSDDEIGQLSEAFDQMTASLKTITVSRDDLANEVAERIRAEEALRQNQRFLETVIRNAPACIKLVAEDGSLLQMNPAGLSILEADSIEQVQGKNISSCASFKYQPAFMNLIKEVFQAKTGTLEFEAVSLKGKPLWLSTNAAPLYDNAGTITALLGITVDITERKRSEEEREKLIRELARSNKELEQFAYVASHDLQEPLRMVTGFVSLLEQKYKGRLDEKADKYIRFAVDGSVRMQKLIEGLLAYSRVSTRGGEFKRVELVEVFHEAVANLSASIQESKAHVARGDLPAVKGDEMQLLQLLQNLIGNAVKFRKPDVPPEVHISAQKKEKEWMFEVRDNGIGIKKENFDKLFQVFTRLHSREEYAGTGIGLAVCKKIVERHGGRIWVDSVPWEGSSFFFTIPFG